MLTGEKEKGDTYYLKKRMSLKKTSEMERKIKNLSKNNIRK